MGTRKVQLLLVIGVLLPFFSPSARDFLTQWNERTQAQRQLEAVVATTDTTLRALLTTAEHKTDAEATAEGIPAEDDFSLDTGCTFGAAEIEALLVEAGSPAAGNGVGETATQECRATGIDNAYFVAFFQQESSSGTNPAWAGNKGNGNYTANLGNIICAGYDRCYGRFRDYDNNWSVGTKEWFQLLKCYRTGASAGCETYWNGRAHTSLRDALNTYAPPVENDTNGYYDYVVTQVSKWRAVQRGKFVRDGAAGTVATHSNQSKPTNAIEVRIPMGGCKATNILSAYNSSPNLRRIEIPPGGDFSFNANWVIDTSTLVECGVYGGGVCSYAAVLDYEARKLGLTTESVYHGMTYEPSLDDAAQVAIWSAGSRGGQDVVLKNTTGKTAYFEVTHTETELIATGWTK